MLRIGVVPLSMPMLSHFLWFEVLSLAVDTKVPHQGQILEGTETTNTWRTRCVVSAQKLLSIVVLLIFLVIVSESKLCELHCRGRWS